MDDDEVYVKEMRGLLAEAISQHHNETMETFRGILSTLKPNLADQILNSKARSMLTLAITNECPMFVQPLLEAKADPNFVDESNVPALNRALDRKYYNFKERDSLQEQLSSVTSLIHAGAFLDSIDRHGESPLFMAVQLCEEEIAKLLIARGADPFLECSIKVGALGLPKTISPYRFAKELLHEARRRRLVTKIESWKNILRFIDENHWSLENRLAMLRIFHPRQGHDPTHFHPWRLPREIIRDGLYRQVLGSHLIKSRDNPRQHDIN